MASFVCRSYRFTRCNSRKDDYRIIFYAYPAVDLTGQPAQFEVADKGDEENLARAIFGALAQAWPDKTITFDVNASNRILNVISVP